MAAMFARNTLLLLTGIALPYACGGTAVIDPPDDDGAGGDGGNGTTSTTSTGGAPSTSTSTSTVGPTSSSSGVPGCIGCGDYVAGQGALESLCGFVAVDPSGMGLTCADDTSCALLVELQDCACSDCGDECASTCMGGEASQACLSCITTVCGDEFNACAGDLQ
jgi:hypothetical protein